MKNNSLVILFIFFGLLSLLTTNLQAQHITMEANDPNEKPTAIMFMLHISTNKIDALKRMDKQEDARDVIQADKEINTSIMRDFKKNFSYCDVYFFYDTQLNVILEKQWSFMTFYDAEHLTSGKKIELSNIDNFIIAEVGYPPVTQYPTIDKNGVEHAPEYTTEYANGRDYGILCYDQNYKLLRNKLQFINISMRRTGNMFKPETIKFQFIGAEKFQQKLEKFYTAQK